MRGIQMDLLSSRCLNNTLILDLMSAAKPTVRESGTFVADEPSAPRRNRRTTQCLSGIAWKWWSLTGSNRRHPACKAGALPAELRPRSRAIRHQRTAGETSSPGQGRHARMVGPGRLELPTSRLSGVRSNHLSYGPILSAWSPDHHIAQTHLMTIRPRHKTNLQLNSSAEERETKTACPANGPEGHTRRCVASVRIF